MKIYYLPEIQSLIKEMLEEPPPKLEWVQIAIQYAHHGKKILPTKNDYNFPEGLHFDGMFTDGQTTNNKVYHFTLLIGVVLCGGSKKICRKLWLFTRKPSVIRD
eukprot:UN34334